MGLAARHESTIELSNKYVLGFGAPVPPAGCRPCHLLVARELPGMLMRRAPPLGPGLLGLRLRSPRIGRCTSNLPTCPGAAGCKCTAHHIDHLQLVSVPITPIWGLGGAKHLFYSREQGRSVLHCYTIVRRKRQPEGGSRQFGCSKDLWICGFPSQFPTLLVGPPRLAPYIFCAAWELGQDD